MQPDFDIDLYNERLNALYSRFKSVQKVGFTGDAYKQSVRVLRKNGLEYQIFNVEEFELGKFQVSDEDSITVDSVIPRFANKVEIKGAVFRPGMYQVGGAINSVRSLLESADGVTEDAFTAHAVMHRMKPDRTLEVISVDIDGIMNGTVADIPMKPNDVLFVPTRSDVMEERTITIHGEVQYPGVYKYADNETLEDFVLQAGGLKDNASTVKVDVARRIRDPKAMTSDSLRAHTFSFALKDGFERRICHRRRAGLHTTAFRRGVCEKEPRFDRITECHHRRRGDVCRKLYPQQPSATLERLGESSRWCERFGLCTRCTTHA